MRHGTNTGVTENGACGKQTGEMHVRRRGSLQEGDVARPCLVWDVPTRAPMFHQAASLSRARHWLLKKVKDIGDFPMDGLSEKQRNQALERCKARRTERAEQCVQFPFHPSSIWSCAGT